MIFYNSYMILLKENKTIKKVVIISLYSFSNKETENIYYNIQTEKKSRLCRDQALPTVKT